MSREKLNNIWKIMKNNLFEYDKDDSSECLCTICKKVLINAHSGPCGCRYCLDCITEYLNGEVKMCPGNTDDCRDELIDFERDIHIDQSMNKKISKMFVICSEKNCQFKDELRNIENHLRMCNFKTVSCPFAGIGCKEYDITNSDIPNHMMKDIVLHSKMLLESMDNLRNELELVKREVHELREENAYLKQSRRMDDRECIESEKTQNNSQFSFGSARKPQGFVFGSQLIGTKSPPNNGISGTNANEIVPSANTTWLSSSSAMFGYCVPPNNIGLSYSRNPTDLDAW